MDRARGDGVAVTTTKRAPWITRLAIRAGGRGRRRLRPQGLPAVWLPSTRKSGMATTASSDEERPLAALSHALHHWARLASSTTHGSRPLPPPSRKRAQPRSSPQGRHRSHPAITVAKLHSGHSTTPRANPATASERRIPLDHERGVHSAFGRRGEDFVGTEFRVRGEMRRQSFSTRDYRVDGKKSHPLGEITPRRTPCSHTFKHARNRSLKS
jgi:hypothetical protein